MTLGLQRLPVPIAFVAILIALATREVQASSVLVVAVAGIVGLAVPLSKQDERRASVAASALVMAAGMAVFAAAATLTRLPSPRYAIGGIVASLIAAVGEEAFFRRGLYAAFARAGPAVAVAATASGFAAVHIPIYGWRAAAVDFAAGLIFGWQRWATGRWSVPAAGHAFANLVAVL